MFRNTNPNQAKYTVKEARTILDINKNASIDDIRRQFKFLARRYHPDISKIQDKKFAHDKFVEINEAFSFLNKKHEERSNKSVYRLFKGAYNKYSNEKILFLTKDECRNFIQNQFITKIEMGEGLSFNINPEIISCFYYKGFYLIRPSAFQSIAHIIKKEYINKYGIDRYNLFYNAFTHRLDSYVNYYLEANNVRMVFIYKNLLSLWEKFNMVKFNFEFSKVFNIKNINRIKTAHKTWRNNVSFSRAQTKKDHSFLPTGIFRFAFLKDKTIQMRKKISNIFDALGITSPISHVFIQRNKFINRTKKKTSRWK